MSLEERKQFDPAKLTEIKNQVVKDVLEKLESHERPPRESILRMRWVLEYRLDENQNKSPKARAVISGYLDPDHASSISNHDEKHQTAVVAIRIMFGILCSQGRRQ